MLSYRHAFHAGNHADILKHLVLCEVLGYAIGKDTPLMYVDTHAGAGIYKPAGPKREYDHGFLKVLKAAKAGGAPDAVRRYLGRVAAFSGESGNLYPGSPAIASACLRDTDRLRLFELHPAEIRSLEANARTFSSSGGRGKRVMTFFSDGFDGLKSVLPPPSRRGVVLIDPPYEVKNDYARVIDTLKDAQKRFSQGVYIVWYPVLRRRESQGFAGKLKAAVAGDWLHATLSTGSPVPDGTGFNASGVFVVNPPYTLAATLSDTLPWVRDVLKTDDGASFAVETSV